MPEDDARPEWIDAETWEWLGQLAAARFAGDRFAAARSVLRAMMLTDWQPNRVDPPTDRWLRGSTTIGARTPPT